MWSLTDKPSYDLYVDENKSLEVKEGNLREILAEIEKYCRLRFKDKSLDHKKKTK